MIEVTVQHPHGTDWAEAETPEAALLAARTLWDEARGDRPVQGFTAAMRCSFHVDGNLVRTYEGSRP